MEIEDKFIEPKEIHKIAQKILKSYEDAWKKYVKEDATKDEE